MNLFTFKKDLLKKDLHDNRKAFAIILAGWLILELTLNRHCPMVILTGLPCPGCGLTRAMFCLLTFDIYGAYHLNPSVFLWVLLIVSFIVDRYFMTKHVIPVKVILVLTLSVTVVVYVIRMIFEFPGDPPLSYDRGNLLRFIINSLRH